MYSYCHKPKRTTFEVLQDFHSIKLPFKYLLDLISIMRPRHFSIASSSATASDKIDLTVAIVEYKTKLAKARTGVCTEWMATWKPRGTLIILFILII